MQLASPLTQISADANRQFCDKDSLQQTLERQEEAGPGDTGQPGEDSRTCLGTESVLLQPQGSLG